MIGSTYEKDESRCQILKSVSAEDVESVQSVSNVEESFPEDDNYDKHVLFG